MRSGQLVVVVALLVVLALLGQGCALPREVEAEVRADLVGYTEGIVFDGAGAGFVSTQNHEAVWVVRGDEAPEVWYRTEHPNGHKVLGDGTHLIAARGGVQRVDAQGRMLGALGEGIATPNDLALDGDGGVYVTMPAEPEKERKAGRSGVYYIDAKGATRRVAEGFDYPNGVVVRADGRVLLVNDSSGREVIAFAITAPGVLGAKRVFATLADAKPVPDGMTLDGEGRLYVAEYGTGCVSVFDAEGRLHRRYATGLKHASNVSFGGVAFGGAGLGDLYVTGSPVVQSERGQLVVLKLGAKGRSGSAVPAAIGGR